MRITIAQRFQPFSHVPGVFCLLPGTTLRLQLFPALIKVADMSSGETKLLGDISLPIKAPLEDFTVLQDLEKGKITLWGKSAKGFQRFHITQSASNLSIRDDEQNQIQIPFTVNFKTHPISKERLSLGNHKSQDWELVDRRTDLAEIFPLWLRLGQSVPPFQTSGKPSLLKLCEMSKDPYSDFINLYKAGFEGILSPRKKDEQYHGYPIEPLSENDPVLSMLSQGAHLIKSLFIQQNKNHIEILPQLPEQFHCGRLTEIQLDDIGCLDLEWSKKQVRKLILRSNARETIHFNFGKKIKSMRYSQVSQPKGSRILAASPIDMHPGESYLFDRFEH